MSSTTWNRPASPGFQGLREDLPLTVYFRHLPHWRQHGATYFVTFRLADSLPQSKLRELELIKQEWAKKQGIVGELADYQSALRRDRNRDRDRIPRERWEALSRTVMAKVEGWLDEGVGECWMSRAEVSRIVEESFHHADNDQCELGAYVIMPNHVHAILRPLCSETLPLEKILQGRKRRSSREINSLVGRIGPLWQEESFDRIIRDEEHLYRCIQYVSRNPETARLAPGQFRRWVRPSWESLGWKFDAL
jgi:putative transposase